jgi:hypothetical protein
MNRTLVSLLMLLGISTTADADIWRWVDMNGKNHYVTTSTPIYTWLDDYGDAHFSDKPGHPNAVRAYLFWHSSGTLADIERIQAEEEADQYGDETEAERQHRLMAEAYYCNQARDIYDTYVSAPQLFREGDDGVRYYLTPEEAAVAISEAQASVDEFCH